MDADSKASKVLANYSKTSNWPLCMAWARLTIHAAILMHKIMESGTPFNKGTSSGWLNRAVGLLGHEDSEKPIKERSKKIMASDDIKNALGSSAILSQVVGIIIGSPEFQSR